ncbi:glycosyltransferase [Ferrimicrobium acidiphilum]|uniref:glycosyltransferase n=1 Tax=Ferrimicrobium acidiphilum TaxID=121039 RepID=UPI0023F07C78|nr:glycosyltransferase [Ferrimicrobium acidiphilum]
MAVKNSLSQTRTVALVIPARNEAPRLPHVLEIVTSNPTAIFDEIIVVNDCSADATAATTRQFRGVRLVSLDDGQPGKGKALQAGWRQSTADVIVTCDADLGSIQHEQLNSLVNALVNQQQLRLTKAAYGNHADSSGRVTELTAKPLLEVFFPDCADIQSPLSGEMAFYRTDVESLDLPQDYGVDIAILLDLAKRHGRSSIAEIPFGTKKHPHQPLSSLSIQSRQVIRAILERVERLHGGLEDAIRTPSISHLLKVSSALGNY